MVAVYASADDLRAIVAPSTNAQGLDERLDAAVLLGTLYVDRRLGNPVVEEWANPPYDLELVPCPPSWQQAALVAAVRFYKSADVPFGVVGGLADYAVRVRMEMPEVDLILSGQVGFLVA
jgi:hypothetical protein